MTSVQATQSVPDSYDLFRSDTLRLANNLSDPELVERLVTESASAIQYLIDLGLPLEQLIQLGGHSVRRTHRYLFHSCSLRPIHT
jgi:aspartate oxidase